MLSINATIEGDKIVISGLREMQAEIPEALKRTLTRAAEGTHREAFDLLTGSAGSPGAYPVPVETGNLRRLLDWLKPDARKGEFKAGDLEAIVYDSAEYARTIHDGLGSSAKFGARPFITDGFERFNEGGKLAEIAAEEIENLAKDKGFK